MYFGIKMKKIIFNFINWEILFFLLIATTPTAFATIHYSRTPSGTEITSPVSVSVSVDSFSDFNMRGDINYWYLVVARGGLEFFSSCVATTTLSLSNNFNIPIGTEIQYVGVYGVVSVLSCVGADDGVNFETGSPLFTIISGSQFSNFHIISGTSPLTIGSTTELMASAGILFSDLWVIIVLAIGIPLAFYIIKRVIALPPKGAAGGRPGKAGYDRKYEMYNTRGEMTGYWKGK